MTHITGSTATTFEFFAGKGGVGKTTCAAAWAIESARAGARVLLVSTDPAHSLGDALDAQLSARPASIPVPKPRRRRGVRLDAIELDAPRAFSRWMRDHREALGDVIEHGTWLDRGDVDTLLALPTPGVDELVGMIEIVRFARREAYDTVVVDTAPTGHTLRLFASPETVGAVATVLQTLQQEHRLIREQLARVSRPEAADRLIELLAMQAVAAGALLRDRKRTRLHWITAPEDLSLAEMADGIGALRRSGIAVADVIVNRLVPDGPRCRLCDLRRAAQRAALARWWRGAIARLPRRNLYEDLPEPRGAKALAALGQRLRKGDRQLASPRRRRLGPKAAAVEMSGRGVSSAPFLGAIAGTQLLFFGGKGGVGKTTAAAATALRLARETGGRVLLLSTDPAHSLADVFGQPIGDRLTTINGGPSNLQVRELDAAAALAARRSELEAAVQEIVATFGAPGARAMPELFDLAPPGIDELVGILSVVDARSTYQTIVVDTAPTGHALRLLEMPAVAQEWVQALLRVLLKHRDLLRPGQLAAELVELSKSVRGLRELMHDPRQTRFVVVTRAADVPRRETVRLLRRLRKIQLATAAIVVNARTLAPGACPRCRATAAAEEQQVAALSRACGRRPCAIIQAPLSAPAPRGVRALERWGQSWMS